MTIPIKNDASATAISRFIKFTMSFAHDEGLKELFQKSASQEAPISALIVSGRSGYSILFVFQQGKLELTL